MPSTARLLLCLLVAAAAAPAARADLSASVTVAPETIQLGGLPPIQSDGKGSYTMDFSITGSRPGAAPQGAPRVLPPISAPPSSALTDPNEFFRNVGGRREEAPAEGRRRPGAR